MIQTDTIIINSTLVPVYVLTYYDGIKEEVDIENHTIYLWYDECDNFEIWLKIKSDSPSTLLAYLRNRIGIMDVINSSSPELYRRSFDNYKEFKKHGDLDALKDIEFPDNERLGKDVLGILNSGKTIRTTFFRQTDLSLSGSNVDFKESYKHELVQTKITSSNDANFDLFETIAA